MKSCVRALKEKKIVIHENNFLSEQELTFHVYLSCRSSLCNPVDLLAYRNSVPGTYCRKFGWALWFMLEMQVGAQMDEN